MRWRLESAHVSMWWFDVARRDQGLQGAQVQSVVSNMQDCQVSRKWTGYLFCLVTSSIREECPVQPRKAPEGEPLLESRAGVEEMLFATIPGEQKNLQISLPSRTRGLSGVTLRRGSQGVWM